MLEYNSRAALMAASGTFYECLGLGSRGAGRLTVVTAAHTGCPRSRLGLIRVDSVQVCQEEAVWRCSTAQRASRRDCIG